MLRKCYSIIESVEIGTLGNLSKTKVGVNFFLRLRVRQALKKKKSVEQPRNPDATYVVALYDFKANNPKWGLGLVKVRSNTSYTAR